MEADVHNGKYGEARRGRVAMRASDRFNNQTSAASSQEIHRKYCPALQYADSSAYFQQPKIAFSPKEARQGRLFSAGLSLLVPSDRVSRAL